MGEKTDRQGMEEMQAGNCVPASGFSAAGWQCSKELENLVKKRRESSQPGPASEEAADEHVPSGQRKGGAVGRSPGSVSAIFGGHKGHLGEGDRVLRDESTVSQK